MLSPILHAFHKKTTFKPRVFHLSIQNVTKFELLQNTLTSKRASLNIVRPNVNSHKGIIPKAAKVLIVVIKIDKSMFPSSMAVQMLEAPPAGDTPVKNIPNLIAGSLGKIT